MNNYLEALDNVVPCKPVNVDERSSYTEETKRYINIYGMRDGYQIKLFHSGDNIEISTDENATKIVEWMEQLYSGIFSK